MARRAGLLGSGVRGARTLNAVLSLGLFGLAGTAAGCRRRIETGLRVEVVTDLGTEVQLVRVRTYRSSSTQQGPTSVREFATAAGARGQLALFTVVPSDEANLPGDGVRIAIEGFDHSPVAAGDQPIVQNVAVVRFEPQQLRAVTVGLWGACRSSNGPRCATDGMESCAATGACEPTLRPTTPWTEGGADASDITEQDASDQDVESPDVTGMDVVRTDAMDVVRTDTADVVRTDAADVRADTVIATDAGDASDAVDVRVMCPTGYADCNGEMSDGCEVFLAVDPLHCGMCGNVCPSTRMHGEAFCSISVCGERCRAGYDDVGGTCVVQLPRAIAPISTSTVPSTTPDFRWTRPAGQDEVLLEICDDRACTTPVLSQRVTTNSFRPSAPLPARTLLWRLTGYSGGSPVTPPTSPWEVTVRDRSPLIRAPYGTTLDVNGDRLADVAVGLNTAGTTTGGIQVYHAGATGFGSPALTQSGSASSRFGVAVASAGDVNGDGFGDLIVGAPGEGASGEAYLYTGSATGVSAARRQVITAPTGCSEMGDRVAGAGDINGDGYGDVVVRCTRAGPMPQILVYHGSATGLPTSPTLRLTDSVIANAQYGDSIAGAGDFNGDGYADLVVGQPSPGMTVEGRAYVYFGGLSGLSSTFDVPFMGDRPGGRFGAAVAMLDANGDGYSDMAVAFGVAPYRVRLFSGSGDGRSGLWWEVNVSTPVAGEVSLANAGDVNADGFDDLLVGATGGDAVLAYGGATSGVSDARRRMITPLCASCGFGSVVAGGGDVDGDGTPESLVGAPAGATGNVYVLSGSTLGMSRMLTGGTGFGSALGY